MANKQVEATRDDKFGYTIHTLKDRHDLRTSIEELNMISWPKFLAQDIVTNNAWDVLFKEWNEYQVVIVDNNGDKLIGVGLTVPIHWDGNINTLPSGWEAATQLGLDDLAAGKRPTALSAFAIMVNPQMQKKGISALILKTILNISRQHGFHSFAVNVRPILKMNYPLIPIETYAYWTNDNGEPFDPWMRVHFRAGAKLIGVSPRAVLVKGTVSQWQEWTKMEFPDSGRYIVSGALTSVTIQHEHNLGIYFDPAVWMIHTTGSV
ncbi:unnamed protein product [Adineta ricciae]|uniref:N-acetyltransferase domain-containing protein n=2 Tax=Adineta ricciae TaxID=249248 RepID=A0A815Q8N5_ADIRI|nr:unnamed protein product [Adineta ricciae]